MSYVKKRWKVFGYVGLSLKIDGLEDHRMKFQGQERGEPADFDYHDTEESIDPHENYFKSIKFESGEKAPLYLSAAKSNNSIRKIFTDLVNIFAICRYI